MTGLLPEEVQDELYVCQGGVGGRSKDTNQMKVASEIFRK